MLASFSTMTGLDKQEGKLLRRQRLADTHHSGKSITSESPYSALIENNG
jgi:hypothetical protein